MTHIRRDHLYVIVLCPICNHAAWSSGTMRDHVIDHHPTSEVYKEITDTTPTKAPKGSGQGKRSKKAKATTASPRRTSPRVKAESADVDSQPQE